MDLPNGGTFKEMNVAMACNRRFKMLCLMTVLILKDDWYFILHL